MFDSVYGNYRTRTFADIFPDAANFIEQYTTAGIPQIMTSERATTLYYLLYARYGNSSISSSDENQWKYKLWSEMFISGGYWSKELDVQEIVRNMSEDELRRGGKTIYNHAYNPGTAPSSTSLEELEAINEQNSSNVKLSKTEAYSVLLMLLKKDVTSDFLDKFKKLFLTVVQPQRPLYFTTELSSDMEV